MQDNYVDTVATTDSRDILFFLAKQCVEDSERWFGDSGKVHDLPHHTHGLNGELTEVWEIVIAMMGAQVAAGKFTELIKKIDRGSYQMTDPSISSKLAEELTDVFIYILNLAGILKVDLYKEYNKKRQANESRFSQQRMLREVMKREAEAQ